MMTDFNTLPNGLKDMIVYMLTTPTIYYNGTPITNINTVAFPDKTGGPNLIKNYVDHCGREAAFVPQVVTRADMEAYYQKKNMEMPGMLIINRSDFEGYQANLSKGEALYRDYFRKDGAFENPGPWLSKLGGAFAVTFIITAFLFMPWAKTIVVGPHYLKQTFAALFLVELLGAVMVTVAGGTIGAIDFADFPALWRGAFFKKQPFLIMLVYSSVITIGIVGVFSPFKLLATIGWIFGITP